MRVLIVGGSGYVGSRLTEACLRQGWAVSVFALARPTVCAGEVEYFQGDRDSPEQLRAATRKGFDAVIDLIAYHEGQTRAMVEALDGLTNRFVHLSTVAVYQQLSPSGTEEGAVRHDDGGTSYGSEKARCERVLEEAFKAKDFPSVTLRAAPLMGPADPVSRENYFLRRIVEGRPIRHPGPLNGYALMLHVDDLTQAIIGAVTHERAAGRAYHLAQADCPRLSEHVRQIARIAGVTETRLEEIDLQALSRRGYRAYAFPYSPASVYRLDTSRAREELGFSPRPYAEALEEVIRWYLSHANDSTPSWPGRGTTQSRLCGTHELLHAELERLDDLRLEPAWVSRPEEVLEQLTGLHGEQPEWVLTSQHRQPRAGEADGRGTSPEPVRVAVVPDFALEFSGARGLTGMGVEGELAWRPGWQLSAVLEPEVGAASSAWLFAQVRPPQRHDYKHGQPVLRVRVLPFSGLEPERLGEAERAVVGIRDAADVEAFRLWLLEQDRAGCVSVPSAAAYGRVYLAGACGWLPRGAGAGCVCGKGEKCAEALPDYVSNAQRQLREDSPGAGVWAATFELSRLLHRAGFEGRLEISVTAPRDPFFNLVGQGAGGAKDSRPCPPLMIIFCQGRHFLCDLFRKRLYEAPLGVAAVLELSKLAPGVDGAVDGLQELFSISRERALKLYHAGLDEVSRLQLNGAGGAHGADAELTVG